MSLHEGGRYYICIFGEEAELIYETWTETVQQADYCTDGIVVDVSPPVAGRITLGTRDTHVYYQVNDINTNICMYWFIIKVYNSHVYHLYFSCIITIKCKIL